MTEFVHVFPKDAASFSPFAIRREPRFYATMDYDADGFWLSANREGYAYLAKLFAEMATRDLRAGYHFHVNRDFDEVREAPDGTMTSVHPLQVRDEFGLRFNGMEEFKPFTFELVDRHCTMDCETGHE